MPESVIGVYQPIFLREAEAAELSLSEKYFDSSAKKCLGL